MKSKILSGCIKLADILQLAKTDYEDAEFEFRKFEKDFSEEEIEEICYKINAELKGVFDDEDY